MDIKFDLRVVELLFSRVCHDLVGPVGAALNGVELLEEYGGEMAEEALGLLGNSARVASRRLKVYRVAYGMAAGAAVSSLADVRGLVQEFIEGSKVTLDWPDSAIPQIAVDRNGIKLILNTMILAAECLPRGGVIGFRIEPDGSNSKCTITAKGQGARLVDGVAEAMQPDAQIDRLDPRTVHSYYLGRFAQV
ncbi:MAG: histidine phosphotransferase family protein, partial [Dongiaceae bacterium]